MVEGVPTKEEGVTKEVAGVLLGLPEKSNLCSWFMMMI